MFSLFLQDQGMGVCTRAHPYLPGLPSILPSLVIPCQGSEEDRDHDEMSDAGV